MEAPELCPLVCTVPVKVSHLRGGRAFAQDCLAVVVPHGGMSVAELEAYLRKVGTKYLVADQEPAKRPPARAPVTRFNGQAPEEVLEALKGAGDKISLVGSLGGVRFYLATDGYQGAGPRSPCRYFYVAAVEQLDNGRLALVLEDGAAQLDICTAQTPETIRMFLGERAAMDKRDFETVFKPWQAHTLQESSVGDSESSEEEVGWALHAKSRVHLKSWVYLGTCFRFVYKC